MFASVDKSESAVFCDTLPLYIARARYWLPHDLHQIQFLFRSVAFTDKIQLLAIVPSTTSSHLIWNVTSLHPREIDQKNIVPFLKPLPSHEALFYATKETSKGLQKGFYEIGLPLNVSSTEASSYENTKVAK